MVSWVPDTPPLLALTIDDGVSSPVVGAYVALAKATGIRLTFFANGVNHSWADHQKDMQPLVDSGQIQIANHTWDHPDIRTLTDTQLVDQLDRNNRYLTGLYGVDTKPYFRPPYMGHTAGHRPGLRRSGLLGDHLVERLVRRCHPDHRRPDPAERHDTTCGPGTSSSGTPTTPR